MPTETETIRWVYETTGLVRVERELVRAADSTERLAKETQKASRAMSQAATTGHKVSQSIRALEGAGRALGGSFGVVASLLGDLESVAKGSVGALGPVGLLGAFSALATLAVPVVLTAGTMALVDIARGASTARDSLVDLGQASILDGPTLAGLDALDDQLARLDMHLTRISAEVGPALVPVVEALANAAERLGNVAASPILDQLAGLDAQALAEGVGFLLGAVGGTAAAGPFVAPAVGDIVSELMGAIAAPVESQADTGPRRTLVDVVNDVDRIDGKAPKRRTLLDVVNEIDTIDDPSRAGRDPIADVAFTTGAAFKLALEEMELAAVNFSGALGGVSVPLQSLGDAATETISAFRESVDNMIAETLGAYDSGGVATVDVDAAEKAARQAARRREGATQAEINRAGERARRQAIKQNGKTAGGQAGGAALAVDIVTPIVSDALSAVPFIGEFAAKAVSIISDIPGFLTGFSSTAAALPGAILDGLAWVISDLPEMFIGEFLPSLIGGLITGVANLLFSPMKMVDGVVKAILGLPAALAESLAGLPVRFLGNVFDPGDNGVLRGKNGRLLGIPGTEKPDRTPYNPATDGGTAQQSRMAGGNIVLVGMGPTTVDQFRGAVRRRQGWAGGAP